MIFFKRPVHWPVRTSRCDVKPRFHVMWFDRKTVSSKTKNANVCSQFRHAWRKPKLKKLCGNLC